MPIATIICRVEQTVTNVSRSAHMKLNYSAFIVLVFIVRTFGLITNGLLMANKEPHLIMYVVVF